MKNFIMKNFTNFTNITMKNITMSNFIIFIILYIVIIVLELYFINLYLKKFKKEAIERNEKLLVDDEEEDLFICDLLKKRLEKLKTMSYKDWIDYNQKNIKVEFNGEKLYIFIYDTSKDSKLFYVRTHLLSSYLNMERNSFFSYIRNKSAYFSQNHIDDNVSRNIFFSSQWLHGCSKNSYIWIDPLENNRPIIKNSVSKTFQKEENGEVVNGYISIGYTTDLLLNSVDYYFDIVENYFLIILFIFIYLVIYFSYNITHTTFQPILLFIILNAYVIYSLTSKDIITDIHFEERKETDLNSSVLGISFLVVANIFVINSLKENKLKYYETSFLFCASLISLMLAMFKMTSYFSAIDIKTHRVHNQIFFNISIIINIFIFINFFNSIYITKK